MSKKEGRFLDMGLIMNLTTNEERTVPVLRFLIEGRDGRQTVGRDWLEVLHCPLCGVKLEVKEADNENK